MTAEDEGLALGEVEWRGSSFWFVPNEIPVEMKVEVDDSYADDEAWRVEVVDSGDGESDKWLSSDK